MNQQHAKQPLAFPIVSLVFAVLYLSLQGVLKSKFDFESQPLEFVCYAFIVLDVFIFYLRPYLMKSVEATNNDFRKEIGDRFEEITEMTANQLEDVKTLIGISGIDLASDELVQKCNQTRIIALQNALESHRHDGGYIITNPFQARDVSFSLIETLKPKDKIIATMNLVERGYLLEDAYRSYFIKDVHREPMRNKKTQVEFIRIMILDEAIKQNENYIDLKTQLQEIGVKILECSPELIAPYSFPGDIILRVRGESESDIVCLVGDRDPHTPTDQYEAKLVFAEKAKKVQRQAESLIGQIN